MSRWLRRYGFTAELLAGMLTDGNQIRVDVEGSYPYDAQLVNSYLEPDRQIVWLVMAHSTFDSVEDGDEIPTYTFVMRKHYRDGDGEADLVDEVERLRERVERLEGVLREVEWTSNRMHWLRRCLVCGKYKPDGHAPGCALDAALHGA